MLLHLSVQNYALIRQLEIDFAGGFSVITGETGAGKSILLGALNLMLGKRADTQVLFDKSKKCIVEGTFSLDNDSQKEFFDKNQLDYENPAILRREIQANGKSRAFINDTPVNANLLKILGENLIDIHSQHQTLALNDPAFQLNVIDSFGGLAETTSKYRFKFREYQDLKNTLDRLRDEEKKSLDEKDYFTFLFRELEECKLTAGEQSQLESELEILDHAEEIKARLFHSAQLLGNDDSGILTKLSEVRTDFNQLADFSGEYSEISGRIESGFIELNDLCKLIEKLSESVVYSPERVNEIKSRLDLIYHLENKHRLNTVEDLLLKKEEIGKRLTSIESLADEITKTTESVSKCEAGVISLAEKISSNRKKHFHEIGEKMETALAELGMPDARFEVRHQQLDSPGKDGSDAIAFYFNANKGGELMDLSAAASGGELSRLMLAVKSLISKKNLLPTMIFDEIDIGVSGKIADKVGNLLKELSGRAQVVAITHLPQIAGKGEAHYYVYKDSDNDITRTHIRLLEQEERVVEIAKLMSGEEVTDASMETARHLLNHVR